MLGVSESIPVYLSILCNDCEWGITFEKVRDAVWSRGFMEPRAATITQSPRTIDYDSASTVFTLRPTAVGSSVPAFYVPHSLPVSVS